MTLGIIGLDTAECTTDCIWVASPTSGTTEVWQARIGRELAAQLRADADVLGLHGRTDIVKAGLALLHRSAAEQRMANGVDEFYGDSVPPLPIGMVPAKVDATDNLVMVVQASGSRGHT